MIHFPQSQQKILFLLGFVSFIILFIKFYYKPQILPEEIYKEVAIEILGEVNRPGVYLFRNPPTIKEAIEKAGGLKEKAIFDTSISMELETGTLIVVSKESPNEIKLKLGRMEAQKLILFSIPLDLNKVSVEDLCLIPDIGESIAREIVSYRNKIGKFRSIEELKSVKGIGEVKFQSIKKYLSVRN